MRHNSISLVGVGLLALAMAGASSRAAGPGRQAQAGGGLDRSYLDVSCRPCDDFYQFATGGWAAKTEIPADQPSWGSFEIVQDRNLRVLHEILEAAAGSTGATKGSIEQKLGDFYASAMDVDAVERAGITPLVPELQRIDQVADKNGVILAAARLQTFGINVPFAFGSFADFEDSTRTIAIIWQGGLGLPERDYYLADDPKSVELRVQYVKHVTRMLELAGEPAADAARHADTVMSMEKSLAQGHLPNVELRNPSNIYHKMDRATLQATAKNFSWDGYFQAIGGAHIGDVNVAQPGFVSALDALVGSASIDDWKVYLRWHLISSSAPYLTQALVDERFNFRGKVLTGATENQPRWKRVVHSADASLGELLGQAFVQRTFPPAAKTKMLEMVANLRAVLREDVQRLDWMSEATKQHAIAKLDAFVAKIGYPDKWRDYSSLKIDRSSWAANVQRAAVFEFKRDLAKIGKPVDKSEWAMTPPTVNAYYNPSTNEITFPAGILQPPFFDASADDAYNYGGIGGVIGHEMTHGFDDEGAKFDSAGNLKNWWAPEDLTRFQARAACIVEQFNGFKVRDLATNGKLVSGESIADLGGLKLAYLAYLRSQKGKAPVTLDGFTPEQRLFIGWARVWATKDRPEFEELMIKTNPHPLPKFRVNGPLSNMPEFRKAFGCNETDRMVRKVPCQIW